MGEGREGKEAAGTEGEGGGGRGDLDTRHLIYMHKSSMLQA